MSNGVKINAEARNEFGKGASRRTRRAGMVPAVIYGHGEKPRHISLPAKEFAAAIRHGGMTTVFDISVSDGENTLALPKAIQRDPLKDTYRHVDLIIVRRGELVTVEVPVHILGEAARGTLLVTEHDKIMIQADALNLPEYLEASVAGLDAGARLTAAAITLPDGVTLATDPETVIVMVSHAPTAEQLEGETAPAAPEAAEPEAAPENGSAE